MSPWLLVAVLVTVAVGITLVAVPKSGATRS
jgi:hypothetical protein